ncbi:MAG: ABC transporter ATP-binding protein [Steroidobacteraceae bacterium]|nr:ABC transporter ATP-binding protein [Nevskiaceae bacterium]MCP5340016.1 ABC transporter ATP-binding protein [Nevskiaceae bacterium]MCP5359238.1 ABC transporter ATP-binding protein [Nevskiaceae bacterium]MCP5466472.1 ABC transporter ATP-binding protein [Nevskiaceae bacterium]MCP5471827.1 ABC transporter ATP-binding protein [Nevskiaceae bacterium]
MGATAAASPGAAPGDGRRDPLRGFLGVFRYSRRALELVWSTSRPLTVALGLLTVLAGAMPAAVAWVGAQIVDAVVAAARLGTDAAAMVANDGAAFAAARTRVIELVVLEGVLVAVLAAAQRALSLSQSLLRAQLGQRVNVMILEKAVTLTLAHFEDSEFYDKLTRARREASSRPLSLVMRSFGLVQNAVSLVSYGVLLVKFSPWAVLVLLLAGLPAFIAEAKFAGDAFRLFRWRSPETRMQLYLETVLAREDYAKEVKLYGLGERLLARYRAIFERLYREDRKLTIRRDSWGFALGLIGTVALYGAYGWIALAAVAATITLGQMTMYLLLFRQGQAAVSASLSAIGGMYEDNLYLSTLYDYLETPVQRLLGGRTSGPDPSDGVRFEGVGFTYPGADHPALEQVTLHLRPGTSLALVGENGSGKTTLIKLLTRLYDPTQGRILLDGLDLREWDEGVVRARVGVIFQDFARYQMLVGENIGAGDEPAFEDEARWREAASQGRAAEFIDALPAGYQTQLGKWFKEGRELSGGQWQKIALSRAFMRTQADILVLDEPTAAMDAQAEADVFEHFRQLASGRIAILISHRFSTVRMADQIVVIDGGRIVEHGSHEVLMDQDGLYARLFALQARGYT